MGGETIFARVDFRRRRSLAHPIPIGKEAASEKMSKIIILTYRSAKAKGQGGSGEYNGSGNRYTERQKKRKRPNLGGR
jgi:hypothetical protein